MRLCKALLAACAVITGLSSVSPAQTQGWPQKTVRVVVPFAAGGNADGIARIIAQHLGESLGEQFIIENKPGAAGALAAETVARAAPDGYMLLMGSPSPISIAPLLNRTTYDPIRDFTPVSVIGTNAYVLVVNPSLPVATFPQFVEYVRQQPNKLSYVSSGLGSLVHLSTGLLLKRTGLQMNPVFYKGGAGPVTDVIAGHVSTYFTTLSDVLPYAKSGTLRMLAVSSEKRLPQIPDVPTFIESGLAGFKTFTWNGLMAPAGTPRDIVDRLAKEVAHGVRDPKVVERLAAFGVEPLGNSPEEFAAMLAADIATWSEAVRVSDEQSR